MAQAVHDHTGAAEKHKHGFVFLHLADDSKNGKARTAIRNEDVSAEKVDIKIEPSFDKMLAVLVADSANRQMDAFHLSMDRVAAQYLALAEAPAVGSAAAPVKYFVFEHHF